MNSTQVRIPPQNVSRVRLVVLLGAGLVVALLGVRVFTDAIAAPEVVDRVTIVNETDYGVDVSVRGDDDDTWLRLGRALPREETQRELVLDQGDVWVVSFDRGGVVGGEIELERSALAANGWKIDVPVEVSTRLGEAGLVPNPAEGELGEDAEEGS